MDWPSKDAMNLLATMSVAAEFIQGTGGEMGLEMPDGVTYVVEPDALDELLARGWLDVTDEGVVLNERAHYWLGRWCRKHKLVIRPRTRGRSIA